MARAPAKRWVPQIELQRLTGWSRQTLAEWGRRPGCPRKPKGTSWVYALPDFFDWKEQEKVRAAVERQEPQAPTGRKDADLRRSVAEARMAEVKLEQLEGRLLAVEDVRREYRALVERVIGILRRDERTRSIADEILAELADHPPPFEQEPVAEVAA